LSEPSTAPPPEKRFLRTKIRDLLSHPATRFSALGLLVLGCVVGMMLWVGFDFTLELTNQESFCISCHEMRNTPYAELQNTIHFKNRSGVRATCPDCHVPNEMFYKIIAKIEATSDIYHHVLGHVDTPQKFEAKREVMAQKVWADMKATDSRNCRNCHSVDSMDPHKQSPASQVMALAMKSGATCIDCHKGIAHQLPK
jgi:cytochrome c-type protein NapC